MNRHLHFVTLVQTGVLLLRHSIPVGAALRVLDRAVKLPEEAIPKDVLAAAQEWLRWAGAEDKDKPKWLTAYEQDVELTVVVQYREASLGEWYKNAGEVIGDGHPRSWRDWFAAACEGEDGSMPRPEAEAFVEWAQTVPGWSDVDPPIVIVDPKG